MLSPCSTQQHPNIISSMNFPYPTETTSFDSTSLQSIPDTKSDLMKQTGAKLTFPMKLHNMLMDIALLGRSSNIVHWNEDGSAFAICDPREFSDSCLPKYFRTNRFASFQRQLRAYGFRRKNLYAGQGGIHIYVHPTFHRDTPERVPFIKREGLTKKCSSNLILDNALDIESEDSEPDFLSYPFHASSFTLSDWNVEKETLK
mmetsp:Transcript_25405/g.38525  ORF Transcript_25405/g.38525 Transcript_25405/m.38525 type:complete len:202 (+) Transcript_25405:192-797(+)|eukprot:CAMPEP_0178938000 /NCGR_PEP_ID=MMETSP0786-20121207/26085_1 /TAXON_ID=186022 /ORGANISM="Thalassionema frauenfeldii, Strain CCMP 1798" /LENGTH=201 /DNA_ID=CAMNT_0020616665 /DNA_START=992 /DNA_END=1597 /DNA_ORIENTATION=-